MTRTHCPGIYGTVIVALTLLLCGICIVAPASAATRFLGDGPAFTVALSGTNEFMAGGDATISLLVRNTGLNDMKQVGVGTIEPEDQQNTAKAVTLSLASPGDAVLVKTDPQMVGDIRGGSAVPVGFRVKISENATAGEYELPLTLTYRYPRVMVQEQADVFEFAYNDGKTVLPVTIRIQPRVKAEVISAVPEQLVAGSEGYLNLTIKNAGRENGTMASVRLLRNGQSPIIPASSTVFIGNYPGGGIVTCHYKVSVSKDATNQTYPVDLAVTYTNREGTVVTSSKITLGVPVDDKPSFSIISSAPEVPRGSQQIIEVRYRNNGNIPVRAAQARIIPHAPLTVSDNNAYLGDIPPGGSVTALFGIQADETAEPVAYTLDSTVRFRDASGTSLESDTIPVQITVVPGASGIAAIPGGLFTVAGCIIAGIVICIAILGYRQKNKSR